MSGRAALDPVESSRVGVAILTWRGESTTRACLESLRHDPGWDGPTAVVDNGSGTGEGRRLASEFGVEVLELPENGGVAVGYNAAVRWARARGLRAVLLANNDLAFESGALAHRLATSLTPGVAAVGPMVLNADGSTWSAGLRVRGWLGHVHRLRRQVARTPYDVDALDGSCLLVSIDAACQIGGLAPEYFLYWEEVDWSARARRAGMHLLVDPTAAVIQTGARTGTVRQRRAYSLRNALLFVRRTQRGRSAAVATAAWALVRVPVFVAHRLLERASPRDVLSDVAWALGFHLRDIRNRGWSLSPDGPQVCE